MSYGSVEERQIDVGLIFDAKTDIDRLGSNIYFEANIGKLYKLVLEVCEMGILRPALM